MTREPFVPSVSYGPEVTQRVYPADVPAHKEPCAGAPESEVDALLAELSQIAERYNIHEFGLPTHNQTVLDSMRAQVQWFYGGWLAANEDLEELNFYRRYGFPYVDHSTMFDKDHVGYWAIMLPNCEPAEEGTFIATVLRAGTVEQLYKNAKEHMARLAAAMATP